MMKDASETLQADPSTPLNGGNSKSKYIRNMCNFMPELRL